jgi:hypothetical protein
MLLLLHQQPPVSLAQLGERQTEVQSLNLEVSRSIREGDTHLVPGLPGLSNIFFDDFSRDREICEGVEINSLQGFLFSS